MLKFMTLKKMTNLHMLIVDDDSLVLEAMSLYFTRKHHSKVCPVSDSEKALRILNRKNFDVILSDVNRPGMSGLEFTEKVRQLSGPPVIIITGYYKRKIRRQAFLSGARACLCKPVKFEQLMGIIKLVVNNRLYYLGT